VDPKAAASGRMLPQLCPLHGCVDALIAKFKVPAKAVSVEDPTRERTGVPQKEI